MNKQGTLAAASAVAAALVGLGEAVGRRTDRRPTGTIVGGAAAALYLHGTFAPRSRLFGRSGVAPAASEDFALTFDDGPDPRHTPTISRLLAERGHQATFFVLARAVLAHPEIAAQLVDDGHTVANHGADHRLLGFASAAAIRRQILECEEAVRDATGSPPARLFRPPHGVRSPWLTRVVEGLGYRVCAWNGSVFDTREPGVGMIATRVDRLLAPGSTVLLHDGDGSGKQGSRAQTVAALPLILGRAEALGLRSARLCVSDAEPASR